MTESAVNLREDSRQLSVTRIDGVSDPFSPAVLAAERSFRIFPHSVFYPGVYPVNFAFIDGQMSEELYREVHEWTLLR